jgi:hypothetical protein
MVQVGLAQFLEFCLRVSEANGNALPMLVAHNSSFDNPMLLMSCWQSGIQVPSTWLHLCSWKLAKGVPQLQELGLENNKLGVLSTHFGCVLCMQTSAEGQEFIACQIETFAANVRDAEIAAVQCSV